jgi:hypothetical protein
MVRAWQHAMQPVAHLIIQPGLILLGQLLILSLCLLNVPAAAQHSTQYLFNILAPSSHNTRTFAAFECCSVSHPIHAADKQQKEVGCTPVCCAQGLLVMPKASLM